jgi:hypothetical protein
MNQEHVRESCKAAGEAIAAQHKSLRTRWVIYLLEVLDAEVGDDIEETLKDIRTEIDARLVIGEW